MPKKMTRTRNLLLMATLLVAHYLPWLLIKNDYWRNIP